MNADRGPAKPFILAAGQAAPYWPRARVAAGIVASGIVLGAASAWLVLKNPWSAQSVQAGAWKTSTVTGSVDADLYARARVAVGGLLALSREETLYYVADRDDAGQPLDLLLVGIQGAPAGTVMPPGARVVVAPSDKGLVLMRVLVGDYATEKAVLEPARRTLRCDPLP